MRTEHQEQALVVRWAELNANRHPALAMLHAVQNWAGVKSPREGARRKAEGVKAGVPDMFLPCARGGAHGLYIEMKRRKVRQTKTKGVRLDRTKPTPEQELWHAALREQGYAVEVCWSAEEAQDAITRYLEAA